MSKYIVIVGDPASGFAFHGPFESQDAAAEWADDECRKDSWSTAPLEEPEL
jgi:hypothetical protein